MYKKIVYSLSIIAFSIITHSCADNYKNYKPETWLGDYSYSYEEIKSFNGKFENTVYDISINRIGDSYKTILNVVHPEKGYSALCDISGNNDSLTFKFNSLLSKTKKQYHQGDILFILKKESHGLMTYWIKNIPSDIPSNTIGCNCFKFNGINKDGNILTVPSSN